MSLRRRLGALIYDWPRFLRHIGGDWTRLRNRDETLTIGPRGVRCEWPYSSELHIANVYPSASRWLLRRALETWPISLRDDAASVGGAPRVSFVIGHRGTERLPNLRATLRSIAAQSGVAIECIVVEQSALREVERELPSWVRYLHTPVDASLDYSRSAAFNAGAAIARGEILVLHDNDMLVPERYAAEAAARASEGARFIDLKRFVFYVGEEDSRALFDARAVPLDLTTTVSQNARGGSIAVVKSAYDAIGGFDESFIGWGGEDNEFWERAEAHGGIDRFGCLPMLHLWHRAQKGKEDRVNAPAARRYFEVRDIPPEERIARLRSRRGAEATRRDD